MDVSKKQDSREEQLVEGCADILGEPGHDEVEDGLEDQTANSEEEDGAFVGAGVVDMVLGGRGVELEEGVVELFEARDKAGDVFAVEILLVHGVDFLWKQGDVMQKKSA
jgi:hypothetical protein